MTRLKMTTLHCWGFSLTMCLTQWDYRGEYEVCCAQWSGTDESMCLVKSTYITVFKKPTRNEIFCGLGNTRLKIFMTQNIHGSSQKKLHTKK